MRALASALYRLAIAVWVGGMLAIGFVAAPVLFTQLADRSVAGALAGTMFSAVSWLGIACGSYLFLYVLANRGLGAFKSILFWIVLIMLAVTVTGHFGVQPIMAQLQTDALPVRIMESALRDRFTLWHRVATALYLLQSALGIMLVLLQEQEQKRSF